MANLFLPALRPRILMRLALFGVILIAVAFMLPSGAAQAQPDPADIACWLVGDGHSNPVLNDNNAPDTLLHADINPFSRAAVPSTGTDHTGTYNIEAIEWEYDGGTLYAANLGNFGTIDTSTGVYAADLDFASSDITVCERDGDTRSHTLDDVDGLAYDLRTNTWWGTERIGNASATTPDVLFRFDPDASGELVIRGQFSVGGDTCDGVEVEPVPDPEATNLYGIDDIAYDPFSDELYGLANTGSGSATVMVRIDRTNGDTTDLGTIFYGPSTNNYLRDTEGFGIDELGEFYVSTGKDGDDALVTGNQMFGIDRNDLIGAGGKISATFVGDLAESRAEEWPTDFEALTCYNLEQQPIAFLGDRVWDDLNADGIQDDGEPGVGGVTVRLYSDVDGDPSTTGDQVLEDTVITAFNGHYLFTVTPGVNYLVEFDAVGALTLYKQGGDVTVDSDAATTTGRTLITYNLTDNQQFLDVDAGITEQDRDWGDADDPPYRTNAASAGASHLISDALYLGACVDSESDGQPSANADGDDTNIAGSSTVIIGTCSNDDDEDGVTNWSALTPGQAATVDVTASGTNSAGASLDAWCDWDGSGSWEPGEEIGTPFVLSGNGTTDTVNFNVPLSAQSGTSYCRFRTSSSGGLLPIGLATTGEVEDHPITIEQTERRDWGDAPDPTYDTLSVPPDNTGLDGASHIIGAGGPYLGACVDSEADGRPSVAASGDDTAIGATVVGTCDPEGDDEDGVSFGTIQQGDAAADVTVVVSDAGVCVLNAWMDFNDDGDWNDTGEQIFTDVSLNASSSNPLTYFVPATAATGDTYARFRCNSAGGLSPSGPADDGEVEDYRVTIEPGDTDLDYGDLPDGPYPTLQASNGAYHVIDNVTFLGAVVPDPDADGQPTAAADGDDSDVALNDEEGVVFLNPLMPGTTAKVQVTAGSAGYLCAYVDFDGDGSLDNVSFSAASSTGAGTPPTAPGTILETHLDAADTYTFDVTVPSISTGTTPARFRFTAGMNQGCAAPDGPAATGEVEDYILAAVSDLVWDDANTNGIQDGGEGGVSGVVVNLLDSSGTPITDAGGAAITTTTDGNGNYEFPGLPPGDYIVEFVAPADHGFSPKDVGSDDTVDSDADPVDGRTDVVTVAPGDDNSDVDTGLYETTGKVAIGNMVWQDSGALWNNGIKEGDEAGLDGVIVELYQDANGNDTCEPGGADGATPLASTTTAGNGFYQFLNLDPSTSASTNYCVVVSKTDPALVSFGIVGSSTGGNQNPNIGDHDVPNGDDGVPVGAYVISQPFAATVGGQSTTQSGWPSGYASTSSYMTVDFGFLPTGGPTAVNLKEFGAGYGSLPFGLLAVAGLMLVTLISLALFFMRRREISAS